MTQTPDPYDEMPQNEPYAVQGKASRTAVLHSLEAEEAVCGAVLIDPDVYWELSQFLKPADFRTHKLRWVWESFGRLIDAKVAVDLLTVSDDLDKQGKLKEAGGSAWLTSLITACGSTLNAPHYGRIIESYAVRRKLVEKGSAVVKLAMDEKRPLDDVLKDYTDLVEQQVDYSAKDDTIDSDDASLSLMERVLSGTPTGVKTGFPIFDSFDGLGGLPIGATMLMGDSSFGKCLAKGTKVVMFDGATKPVEDIVVGDLLMGVDSTPRKVLSLSSGIDEMYKINQIYGIDYVVNSRHILSLKRSANRGGHVHDEILNVPAADVYARKSYYQTHYKCYKTGVEFDEKEVPLEPYFLGLWLGDGTSASSAITNPDQEIIDYIYQYASRLGLGVHVFMNSSKCPQLRITDGRRGGDKRLQGFNVMTALNSIGVLNNKHIPYEYLCNSKEKRLSLLAGLLDSDGYLLVQSKHSYEITQKNRRLALDIKRLADSLGFRTTIVEKMAQSQNGTKVLVYRMNISGNVDEVPVLVERKKATSWTSYEDWQISGFKIESIGIGEYFGFSLDGDSLFLLEDFTVTHNSTIAEQVCEQIAMNGQVAMYMGFESTNDAMVLRRVAGIANVNPRSVRTATMTDIEKSNLVNAITNEYQGRFGGRLKFNNTATTLHQVEKAIRTNRPAVCVIDQISQITDDIANNPTMNLLKIFTRLKAIGNKYGVAMLIVHAITAEESKQFFERNKKAILSANQGQAGAKKQKNLMPDINAIPWASQIKFLSDAILFLVPEVNQQLVGASVYEMLIWIMKDRDGQRFEPTFWDFDLKAQWFTDKPNPYKKSAQRPSTFTPVP